MVTLTSKDFFPKKVKITTSWDDGHRLDLKIVDLLRKYKISGTFYIVVDWVDKEGFLTWGQIKELAKMGFSIGSHTITHPPDLKKLHDEELHYETQNSKDMLETALGLPVRSFCYPRGRVNERVRGFVGAAID